jgi:hypothetical protein
VQDFSNLIIVYLGVGVAWSQLSSLNTQRKADFTYKIYKDLLDWLTSHKDCREWIFSDINNFPTLKPNYKKWEFDDYLGYFEAIWSLRKRKLVDEEIVYDLLSDYLIPVYEANNYELKTIIQEIREQEGRDFYEGVEKLYKKMKKYEQKKGNKEKSTR